jgi:hypothetical protein
MRKLLLIALPLLFASAQASAEAWTADFNISALHISLGENYHYRTYGMPAIAECPGQGWAFVNESDSGAKGQIAALLMAYASGKQVRLFVAPSNGYCHIIEVLVSG